MFTKFVAIILCAVCLLACIASVAGIITAIDHELYLYDEAADWITDMTELNARSIAYDYCTLYAAEEKGGCTKEMIAGLFMKYHYATSEPGWSAELYENGILLRQSENIPSDATKLTFDVTPIFPTPNMDDARFNMQYTNYIEVLDPETQTYSEIMLAFCTGPEYQVVMYLHTELIDELTAAYESYHIEFFHQMRYYFIFILVVALLAFAALLVYLCDAAGRSPHSPDICPAVLNRIPLDLYAAMIAAAEVAICWTALDYLYSTGDILDQWGVTFLTALSVYVMAVLVVAYIFAFAAQVKVRGGMWWRRTVLAFVLKTLWLCLKWIGRLFRWAGRSIVAIVNMLPLVWQWVFIVMLMAALPLLFHYFYAIAYYYFWYVFWGVLCYVVLILDAVSFCWWIWYMGQILKGTAIISQGNLEYQIPTRFMYGRFRRFAESLNSIAEASRLAAERQLKSERMKTELITNVSHDIKTPLTSIINYVDLMKKPHNDSQEDQYLEVLDRQSQRLKKLIVDLMDMSKASTGNITVELEQVDAVEAVNQALGEFSDKLTLAGLLPLFHCPQETMMIRADGRLLWRVLSNLLGNAVKYAMPGTRLYLDLERIDGNAVLSIKNISQAQLNVDAEELLERFVRGDASRNTEGSGLGLNIAKSLMELQGGQMHLTVDGDLFKVTIVMPLCDK